MKGLSGGFDDLPQLAVRPAVPDAAITVRALLLEHAEADKLASSSAALPGKMTLSGRAAAEWVGRVRGAQRSPQ